MRRAKTSTPLRLTAAVALLASALPGCVATTVSTSGNEPAGNVRVPETPRERELRLRRKDAEDAAAAAKEAAARPPAAANVTASVRHHQFHRADCPNLAETPAADRVTFSSPYAAIDAGFSPCAHCRPGP